MKEKINQEGFVQIPLLIGIIFSVITVSGVGYGAFEYNKTSNLIKEADQLAKEENYIEANSKLETAQNKLPGKIILKQKISTELDANKKLLADKTKYDEGVNKLNDGDLQGSINLLSELPEDSFYYQKAQTKIEESKRKMVEGELSRETIAKLAAETKAKQEEYQKNLKTQELADKAAAERMMNADNDWDGLVYRRELELGTSDWNTDSDGDGIKDNEDLHPAGGGRYIAQEFEWNYEGKLWTWKYSIHEDWYEYYKRKPRTPHGTEYITPNDPFIKEIAKTLKESANKENYHLTSFIVSFIQGLPYVEDYYTGFDERPKYPIETFIERNGDCEDTSYLFSTIVQAAGLGAALVEFNNHMGVGVKTVHSQSGYYYPIGDEWYYYYETTGEGWQIGDLPEDHLYEKAKITRIWDGSVNYLYPQYIKPCYISSAFSNYYTDGKNYYLDSQCSSQMYCLSYKEFYVNPQITSKLYWDGACSQEVVTWCPKSTYSPGYFYNSINQKLYIDSRCTILKR